MKLSTPSCLCCSHQLLRHVRKQQIVWFCCQCRQEMPAATYMTTHTISYKNNSLALSVGAS
ncbi:MAG: hypothetical protein ACRC32_28950 [Chroococcidiopsis sp.]